MCLYNAMGTLSFPHLPPSFSPSLQSYDFEVHASGFKHHTRKEHNVEHYILFFIYLMDKVDEDEESLTSHELSVVHHVCRSACFSDFFFFCLRE